MLNPGKCIAKNQKDITETPKIFYSEKIPLLNRDSTQGIVANIVKEAYGNNQLPAYIFIVNLSNRRETDPEKLSKEDFKTDKAIVDEIKDKVKKNSIKWIWIAFGKESKGKYKESIDKLKETVLNQLNKLFEDRVVGCENRWHPRWLNYSKNVEQRKSIRDEINKKLHNS